MDYGGDVTPHECWEKLKSDNGIGIGAILIDVRTRAEWSFVGVPTLEESMQPMIGQEWQAFPDMAVDEKFSESLKSALSEIGATSDTELCFLCRSGGRSLAAARSMTAIGFPNTFNVTGGFEGDPDEHAHRGNRNGWKAEGLPWKQG